MIIPKDGNIMSDVANGSGLKFEKGLKGMSLSSMPAIV